MNLQAIEKLELNDGDVVLIRAKQVSNEQLTTFFSELRRIKRKSKKDVDFVILNNQWADLINVQITDIKGAMFSVDLLMKQLLRIQDGLVNKLKIEGTADQITKKVLQNLDYIKNRHQQQQE